MSPDRDACLAAIAEHGLAAIAEHGYVVLEGHAAPALVDELESTLEPLLAATPKGRNDFEGLETRRVYNLLAKGDIFQRVACDPFVIDLVESVLGADVQVSIISAIQILPGETAQGMHTDDGLFPLPWPHPPVVCNTLWAIDDFTAANGGTRVAPGSHRWPERREPAAEEVTAVEMPRGSVLVWLGNLVHEGGPNTSAGPRLGITMNYNQGWLRQQENQYLGVPREVVARFPERLRRLVGYDVHPPFIGHVDGRNPARWFGG